MDIVAAYQQVGTYRGAAEICGTTHKTVKRVIERVEAGDGPPLRKERERNYEAVAELVAKQVKDTKGRISAKRLLPAARTAGYQGSARNFRRLVVREKAAWRREHQHRRRPAVWTPGEYLVIDWGMLAGLHVFCAVLAWSRWRFVRFAGDEKQTTTLGLLAECFAALGGVPKVVLADRMGCLKADVVANKVVPTSDYVRFATHYSFRPDWCEAADPASKGIVENLVGYAKNDLLVPLLAEHGGATPTVAAANAAARTWCGEVNAAVHSEIAAVPIERIEQERELLSRLPSLGLRIGPAPVLRTVDRLSCVRFGSARYSVPTRLVGAKVEVLVCDGRILVVETGTGEVVAEHSAVAPGEASVLDEHYGGARPAPRRPVRPKTAAEKAFCALGPVAEAFIAGAAAAGNTRLGPELAELADLEAAHGRQALIGALDRAIAFGRWRADDVRSILTAGAGLPRVTDRGQELQVNLPAVPTRELSAYSLTALAEPGTLS